jgi:hypothetical protein
LFFELLLIFVPSRRATSRTTRRCCATSSSVSASAPTSASARPNAQVRVEWKKSCLHQHNLSIPTYCSQPSDFPYHPIIYLSLSLSSICSIFSIIPFGPRSQPGAESAAARVGHDHLHDQGTLHAAQTVCHLLGGGRLDTVRCSVWLAFT